MANVAKHGDGWRTEWRLDGRKVRTTVWPEEAYADRAKAIVEAHLGRIDKATVEALILGDNAVEPEEQEEPKPFVKDQMKRYLDAKTRLTPGTLAGYQADSERHIMPTFGELRLDEVDGPAIGVWINKLRENDYKNTSITRYFSLLSAMFEAAIREGIIDANPCDETDFERNQVDHDDDGSEGAVYLEKREYFILEDAVPFKHKKLVECLFGTGARWSEATALAVEDLIPPSRGRGPRIRIRRAWKRDPKKGPYLGTTKGRNLRTLNITLTLFRSLEPLTKGQPKSALLFRTPSGGRIEYGNFYKQVWRPSVARAMRCAEHPPADRGEVTAEYPRKRCREFGGTRDDGKPCGQWTKVGWTRCVDHIGPAVDAVSECECKGHLERRPTPHDARHTHAAWLLSAGIQPVAVQRRLGHERLETTVEIYGGLLDQVEEDVIRAIELRRGGTGADMSELVDLGPRRSREDRTGWASRAHRRSTRRIVVMHRDSALAHRTQAA